MLSKEVPSSSISTANTEIAAILQPSVAGAKAVRGTYLKISVEKKAELGQCAAEHGVLPTVQYHVYVYYIRPNSLIVGSKAYDTVWHKRLSKKNGIEEKFIQVCRGLYEGIEVSVVLEGGKSRWFPVETGLCQGCPLSPIL